MPSHNLNIPSSNSLLTEFLSTPYENVLRVLLLFAPNMKSEPAMLSQEPKLKLITMASKFFYGAFVTVRFKGNLLEYDGTVPFPKLECCLCLACLSELADI